MTNEFVPLVPGQNAFLYSISTSHEFGAVASDEKPVLKRRNAAKPGTHPIHDAPSIDSEIHDEPIRQVVLSKDLLQRIAKFREAIIDAYEIPLDDWTDTFMRHKEPESALNIYEICAVVYRRIMAGKKRWSRGRKQGVFNTIRAIALLEQNDKLDLDAIKGCPSVEAICHMLIDAIVNGERP